MYEFTSKNPVTRAKMLLWVAAIIGLAVITLPKAI